MVLKTTDKAAPSAKATAHVKFQEIAFAYAILSSPSRRARYDRTGSTSESLDLDDDTFNWSDFFRQQWAETVTGDRLNSFKSEYQNSTEEVRDVILAYTASKGNLNRIFRTVMLSNPLEDEDRFRGYIDAAISKGEVQSYPAYANEDAKTRKRRMRNAKREATLAEAHARKSGVYDTLFGDKTKKKNQPGSDEAEPAQLLQQRAKNRANTFLEDLEAKYARKGAGKKRKAEPSEAAFQETAKRLRKNKPQVIQETNNETEEEDVEIDLDAESNEDDDEDVAENISDDDEDKDGDEEPAPLPSKSKTKNKKTKKKPTRSTKSKAKGPAKGRKK